MEITHKSHITTFEHVLLIHAHIFINSTFTQFINNMFFFFVTSAHFKKCGKCIFVNKHRGRIRSAVHCWCTHDIISFSSTPAGINYRLEKRKYTKKSENISFGHEKHVIISYRNQLKKIICFILTDHGTFLSFGCETDYWHRVLKWLLGQLQLRLFSTHVLTQLNLVHQPGLAFQQGCLTVGVSWTNDVLVLSSCQTSSTLSVSAFTCTA